MPLMLVALGEAAVWNPESAEYRSTYLAKRGPRFIRPCPLPHPMLLSPISPTSEFSSLLHARSGSVQIPEVLSFLCSRRANLLREVLVGPRPPSGGKAALGQHSGYSETPSSPLEAQLPFLSWGKTVFFLMQFQGRTGHRTRGSWSPSPPHKPKVCCDAAWPFPAKPMPTSRSRSRRSRRRSISSTRMAPERSIPRS